MPPSKQAVPVDALPHGGPRSFTSVCPEVPTATFPQGIWRGRITNVGCGLVPTITVPALLHAAGRHAEGSCVTFHGLVAHSCIFTLKPDTHLLIFYYLFPNTHV